MEYRLTPREGRGHYCVEYTGQPAEQITKELESLYQRRSYLLGVLNIAPRPSKFRKGWMYFYIKSADEKKVKEVHRFFLEKGFTPSNDGIKPFQCPNCGEINRRGAKFCLSCGISLTTEAQQIHVLKPGQPLHYGRYTVIDLLKEGGMGALYLAHDTKTYDRVCIIKQMKDYFDSSNPQEIAEAEKLFENEGRILAALNHTNIPKIYDYFLSGKCTYIVMEYIEGTDLTIGVTHRDSQSRIVKAKPFSQEEIIKHAIRICKVLEYLHSFKDSRTGQIRPVVHHDIKPANIILDKNNGEAHLVDFGIARPRQCKQIDSGSVQWGQTEPYGTEGYAPPEQYRGQSEPRSDIYALGATIYHLLTDDNPQEHPSLFPKLGSLPPRLSSILEKALRENASQRYSASELRGELESLLVLSPLQSSPKLAQPKTRHSTQPSPIPTQLKAKDPTQPSPTSVQPEPTDSISQVTSDHTFITKYYQYIILGGLGFAVICGLIILGLLIFYSP